jgi:hypothetical protein
MPEAYIPSLLQTRVLKLVRIRRERMLPTRGTVMMQTGNRVGSLDIVARAESVGHLRSVPLARYLHVAEKDLAKYLVKQPGDQIQAREIIASKPEFLGTLRRIYRAPSNGKITALQGAWLTMDLIDEPFELKALYRGTIINVMPRQGVVIEATGAWIQGVWGTGGESFGVLKKMVDAPDQVLTDDKIDLSARGVILIAGAGVTEATIQRAVQERAAGLIVGGLQPHLRQVAKNLGLTTIVTEGLGERAMSAPMFDLLTSHNGDEAVLNTFDDLRGMTRPEIFIPVLVTAGSSDSAMPPPALIADVGSPVRIAAGAHRGEIGKIVDMPAMPRTLESGVQAWGAEVQVSEEHFFVPWDNLELID